jgi:SSS family solute:Na+ symporter
MHIIDFAIFIVYMVLVFLVGAYFFRKNKSDEDYYVGGRNMSPYHIGLSVVATDVGGGFSIGLGGLGYMIGLSGSWLLFTGLIGAWLSAVLIIPKIKKVDVANKMLSYPDFLRFKYNDKVALIAAIISGIGYMGFTGGQILAGAKLSAATLFKDIPIDMDPMLFSLLIIAGVILIYTVLGGLKAVVYTDTIQWIILLSGLIFFAIPFTLIEVGGFSGLSAAYPMVFLHLQMWSG